MCLGMWALAAGEVSAQDMKLVSGRIVNKNTKKPFGQEAVFIYAFNTVAEAEDARKVIDSKNGFFESSSMEAASADYWRKYVGLDGAVLGMEGFGASAPGKVLAQQFGFTVEHLVALAEEVLRGTAAK